MSADEAEDWLKVAVGEVIDAPAWMLREGAEEARRTCTHHAQIVPKIVAAIEKRQAERRSIEQVLAPIPALPRPRLSDEEFEEIVAARGLALSAMLDRGVIVSNGDGTFRRAEDAA